MILRLVLIASIFSIGQSLLSMKSHCDDNEMYCIQSKTCSGKASDEAVPLKNPNCSVQVHFRTYSKSKMLVRMRTTENTIKFIFPKNNDGELFGCKLDNGKVEEITGKTLTAAGPWKAGLECEFVFEADPMPWITQPASFKVKYGEKSEMLGRKDLFGNIASGERCDMDWLDVDRTTSPEWVVDEVDRRFDKVVCSPRDSELMYSDGATFLPAAKIACAFDTDLETFYYTITPKDNTAAILVDAKNKRKIACRRRICTQCHDVPCPKGVKCNKPDLVVKDNCATLECPSGFFQVNGRNATTGTPKCVEKNNKKGETVFRWMFGNEEVKQISCPVIVNCQNANPLRKNCEKGCNGLDLNKNNVTCATGRIVGDPRLKTMEIKCDNLTGRWLALDEDGPEYSREVRVGTELHCEAIPEYDEEEEKKEEAGMGTGTVVGIVVVVILIILVIVGCIVARSLKKSKKKGAAKEQESSGPESGVTNNEKSVTGITGEPKSTGSSSSSGTEPGANEAKIPAGQKNGAPKSRSKSKSKGKHRRRIVVPEDDPNMPIARIPDALPVEPRKSEKRQKEPALVEKTAVGSSEEVKDGEAPALDAKEAPTQENQSLECTQSPKPDSIKKEPSSSPKSKK